jgi:hypothetical protein
MTKITCSADLQKAIVSAEEFTREFIELCNKHNLCIIRGDFGVGLEFLDIVEGWTMESHSCVKAFPSSYANYIKHLLFAFSNMKEGKFIQEICTHNIEDNG